MAETISHRTRVGRDRSARTRARIIEAAAQVFALQGAESPVIEDFIRAAEVSRGTFYNHFRTVTELLEATIDWLANDVIQASDPAIDAIGDVALRFASGLRSYLHWAAANPRWCELVARIPQVGTLAHARVLRDLREGRRLGMFDFPSLDAAYDLAVGTGIQAIRRMAEQPRPPEKSDEVVAVVMRGLGVAPERLARIMAAPLPESRRPSLSEKLFKD